MCSTCIQYDKFEFHSVAEAEFNKIENAEEEARETIKNLSDELGKTQKCQEGFVWISRVRFNRCENLDELEKETKQASIERAAIRKASELSEHAKDKKKGIFLRNLLLINSIAGYWLLNLL